MAEEKRERGKMNLWEGRSEDEPRRERWSGRSAEEWKREKVGYCERKRGMWRGSERERESERMRE